MKCFADLLESWQADPQIRPRSLGGVRALDGFHYQLAISLHTFFRMLRSGDPDASTAFEVFSDVAVGSGSLVYLTQVKTTLTPASQRRAIEEFLAVDEWLARCFPAERERFRFQLTVRRAARGVALDTAALTGDDLKLAGDDARRWEQVRERCQPVRIEASPHVELAIRLFPEIDRPFALVDRCVGSLMNQIARRNTPNEIAEQLGRYFEEARRPARRPMALLGPGDFRPAEPNELAQRHVVHGVRPAIEDIREGRFMPRPEKLEAALGTIYSVWEDLANEQRVALPVFWITGPSGAGKSVLALQVAEDLLASGTIDAVNWVHSYAGQPPDALAHAGMTQVPILIQGDDLFALENRSREVWDTVGALALGGRLRQADGDPHLRPARTSERLQA